jgi:hypothetical protein
LFELNFPVKLPAVSLSISELGGCIFVYLQMKNLLLLLFTIPICAIVFAQSQNERKVATTQLALFNKVANLDSSLFAAYNSKNIDLMKTYFTKDLEWYQDNGGLIDYEKVFLNFQ